MHIVEAADSSHRQMASVEWEGITGRVKQLLDSKLDVVESKLDSKLDSVESKLDGKLDSVESKLKAMDSKLDNVVKTLLGHSNHSRDTL